MRVRTCLAILVLSVAAATTVAEAGEPTLTVAENRVEAVGLRPAAEVVLIGVIKQNLEWIGRTIPVVEYGTADASGRITFDLHYGAVRTSAWALVDLFDGGTVILSPVAVASRSLQEGELGLSSTSESLVVLVARPGVGAWFGRVVDGGALDADGGSDGRTSIAPALLRAASLRMAQEPPSRLLAGDLTVAIDLHTLEVQMVRTAGLADSR